MAGSVPDKVLAPLAGKPVFAYSAAAFAASGVADFYVVVYRDRSQMTALSAFAPTPSVLVRGGRERQDSVAAALAAMARRSNSVTSSPRPCRRWPVRPMGKLASR